MGSISETNRFIKISFELVRASMPALAKDLLLLLDHHRNKQTGQCNPFRSTLAKELGTNRRSIAYAITWLRQAELITVERHGRTSATYNVAPQSEWLKLIRGAPKCTLKGLSQGAPRCTSQVHQGALHDRTKVHLEGSVSLYEKKNEKKNRTESACTNGRERGITTAAVHTPEPPRIAPPEPEPEPPEDIWSSPERVAADTSDKLLALHPRAGLPKKARVLIRRLCLAHAGDLYGLIERIGVSHRAWRLVWAAGGHIPLLWQWFDSGDWEQVPSDAQIRKPASRHEPDWLTATRARVEARKALETGA